MILKVSSSFGTVRHPVYVYWWRKRVPKWPALQNAKLPSKLYTRTGREPKILLCRLHKTYQNFPVCQADINEAQILFKTDRTDFLIDFISSNDYPPEFLQLFLKQI